MRIIFLVAVGLAAWLVYRLYLRQLLAQGKAGRIKIALIAVGFLFLALAVTGRAPALFAVLGALMTQAMRFWPLLVRFAPGLMKHLGGNPLRGGAFGGGSGGAGAGASQVRTGTVLMTLDHASGQMDGEVLKGEFRGRTLSSMAAAEIIRLHTSCRADDPEALRLLEAYIARERAAEFENGGRPDDRPGAEGTHGGAGHGSGQRSDDGDERRGGSMSLSEAADVLGLPIDTDRETVIAAHRTLMSRLHPDKGGSDYLAMKVNAARQVMLDALARNS